MFLLYFYCASTSCSVRLFAFKVLPFGFCFLAIFEIMNQRQTQVRGGGGGPVPCLRWPIANCNLAVNVAWHNSAYLYLTSLKRKASGSKIFYWRFCRCCSTFGRITPIITTIPRLFSTVVYVPLTYHSGKKSKKSFLFLHEVKIAFLFYCSEPKHFAQISPINSRTRNPSRGSLGALFRKCKKSVKVQ